MHHTKALVEDPCPFGLPELTTTSVVLAHVLETLSHLVRPFLLPGKPSKCSQGGLHPRTALWDPFLWALTS